jgi:hypothetical protein
LGWLGLAWAGMGWLGLAWAGLGWLGMDWAGLGWLGWLAGLGLLRDHRKPTYFQVKID